jgi:hypothetical protein
MCHVVSKVPCSKRRTQFGALDERKRNLLAMAEKKFMNAKNTQESIQGIALWAIQHKNQHSQVVEVWLNVLKKCKFRMCSL